MVYVQRAAKFLLAALLLGGGCHFLGTGSPIPLWDLETLQSPVAVREITDEYLILDNGQKVKLPMIQRIAVNQPLFRLATEQGVEIQGNGEVIGLAWLERACGNDPYVWCRVRVNLSEWSGTLEPTGIDPRMFSPDDIQFLEERARENFDQRKRGVQRGKITIWDRIDMRDLRRAFDAANGNEQDQNT